MRPFAVEIVRNIFYSNRVTGFFIPEKHSPSIVFSSVSNVLNFGLTYVCIYKLYFYIYIYKIIFI